MDEQNKANKILKLLDNFVLANEELDQLEQLLDRFNIFDALGCVRQERRHSDFLRFLLDPDGNHGLGDLFLKRFLQKAVAGPYGHSSRIAAAELEAMDLRNTQVLREWNDIDIFLRNDESRLAVIIENKIDSTEHSDQLNRYFDCVERECARWTIIGLYLTPDCEDSSEPERYLSVDYKLVHETVQSIIRTRGSSLPANVLLILNDYIEMLRRHLMTESDISDLCKGIYAKHREALDLIYEHRPDPQQLIRELLEQLIGRDSRFVLDKCTKSAVRFVPKAWETPALKKGSGWTPSGRILLFEFANLPDSLRLYLYLGPGPVEIRQKILACAQRNKAPFTPSESLSAKWNTLFSYTFLSGKSREGDYDNAMKNEIERQWKAFTDGPLTEILKAFESEPWN
jgi:hypothetical protein